MDFQLLFAHIPETIVVLAPEPGYKILAATNTYLRTTMRQRENIVGLQFLLEAYPDSAVPYEENPVKISLDKALTSKKTDSLDVLRYDIVKPTEDGGGLEERYWEASHTPVLDASGHVLYIIQNTHDVTERELAKQAQQKSEQKFRFMAESMPQIIYTVNTQGEFTYFNQHIVHYTGLPLQAFAGTGWQQIIHPDDLPTLTARFAEVLQTGADLQIELRIRDKEGNYRWHLLRSRQMKDENNNPVMRVGSATDIHDTRLLVQELLTTNEQMADLSDQVQFAYQQAETKRKTLERLIMESPAFFCIIKGPEHRYELINQNYQKLFPNRVLLNKTVAEALPEVIDQGFIDILDNVYKTGKTFMAEETLIKIDRYDNHQLEDVYLTFTYQPLYKEDEQIIGIIVFGYEVTEQVLLKKKLEELGNA